MGSRADIRYQADTDAIAVSIWIGLDIKEENMYEDNGTIQPNESFTKVQRMKCRTINDHFKLSMGRVMP